MFDKENFEKIVCEFAEKSEWNYIKKEEELEEGLAGKRMYEVPLIGYGAADDSLLKHSKIRKQSVSILWNLASGLQLQKL